LAAFVSATKDDDNILGIFTKIHPISWAEEQPQFGQSFADGFNVSVVSLLNSEQAFDNSPPTLEIAQSVNPGLKRFISISICIKDNLFRLYNPRQNLNFP
jgi:hypothetical protein